MVHALHRHQYGSVAPLFECYLSEPLLWAVLEGRHDAQVWVDDADSPQAALVWTKTECAYVVGGMKDPGWHRALRVLVQDELLPGLQALGRTFLSLFSSPAEYADVLAGLFQDQVAQVTPLETYVFDRGAFWKAHLAGPTPRSGFSLDEIDRAILRCPGNEALVDEVVHYWGDVDAFLEESYGYCVLHQDRVLSYCYSEAYGSRTRGLSVWTCDDYRRQGFATMVVTAMIDRCLSEGQQPYWMCDQGNVASRRLAERLGFVYQGDILLVEVPLDPFSFYRGLAIGFHLPNGQYRRAGEAYERAFQGRAGDAVDYYDAAAAWAMADDTRRALHWLRCAIACGWRDLSALETEDAFRVLRTMPEWRVIVGKCVEPN